MKKIYGLMLVPVLALSGCVSKITNEEGVKRAEEIAKHEIKDADIQEVALKSKTFLEATVTQDGVKSYMKMDMDFTFEISRKNKFVHYFLGGELIEQEGKDKTSSKGDSEYWLYINKDGEFISAYRTVDEKGKETKTYSVVSSKLAEASFEASLEGVVGAMADNLKAETELAEVSAMLSQTEKEAKEEGMTYTVSAYSGGEGSLVVKGKVDVAAYEGIKCEGSGKVKYVWKDYMLTQVTSSMSASVDNAKDKISGSVKSEINESVKFRVRASQPNLSGYKKVAL